MILVNSARSELSHYNIFTKLDSEDVHCPSAFTCGGTFWSRLMHTIFSFIFIFCVLFPNPFLRVQCLELLAGRQGEHLAGKSNLSAFDSSRKWEFPPCEG